MFISYVINIIYLFPPPALTDPKLVCKSMCTAKTKHYFVKGKTHVKRQTF